jgi:hypothetical protein
MASVETANAEMFHHESVKRKERDDSTNVARLTASLHAICMRASKAVRWRGEEHEADANFLCEFGPTWSANVLTND